MGETKAERLTSTTREMFLEENLNLEKILGVTTVTNLATRKANAKSGKESKKKDR